MTAIIIKKDKELISLRQELLTYKDTFKGSVDVIHDKFEIENTRLSRENVKLKTDLDDLNRKILEFKNQAYQARKTAEKLQDKEDKLQSSIKNQAYSIEIQNLKNKTLTIENDKMKKIIEMYLGKLKMFNAEKEELEERLRQAEAKIIGLTVRAAAGYENLTPRPDFNNLNSMIILKNGSTQKKVEELVKTIRELQIERLRMKTSEEGNLLTPRKRVVRKLTAAIDTSRSMSPNPK